MGQIDRPSEKKFDTRSGTTTLSPEVAPHSTMLDRITDEQTAEVAQHLLDNVLAQGRAADEKVRALFSTNSIFVAVIAIGTSANLAQLPVQSSGSIPLVGLILRGLLLLSLATSTAASVLGLLPRLKNAEPDHSMFFFGHIANLSQREFIRDFKRLDVTAHTDQLLSQVHVNSQIVQLKYKWIRRSATFLLIGVGLWLLVLLVTFFG
jgi:hypothetical protein